MLKKLSINLIVLFFAFLPISKAQDSLFIKKLIHTVTPKQLYLQYGGSIGFLSGGIGYPLWKDKGNLSTHFGFVPESQGGAFSILAVKLAYQPFNINFGKRIDFKPFNPVIFPSYTLGSNFSYKFSTNQYRPNYYFWSSALRLHIGASSEMKIYFSPNSASTKSQKAISIFAEANTNDLYAISWFNNRSISPFSRIFRLGFGLKAHF